MVRSIANDIRLNATWFFWVFLFLNVELILGSTLHLYPHRYRSLSVGLSYAMTFPLVLVLREEYWRVQAVNRSLPLSIPQLVVARYVSIALLGLLPALYGWLYQDLIEVLGPPSPLFYRAGQMEAGYAIEHSLIARMIGLSVALAVILPLIFRFGSVWRIIFGYIVLRIVWGKIIDYLLSLSLHAGFFLGLSRWMVFAAVFVIAILALSVGCSFRLCRQRQL